MPARLHLERIARSGTAPARWLAITHGIYGAGMNWRAIARKVNERRPEWGVVLVDLRNHGRSERGAPPHTIAACADDVRAMFVDGIDAIAGHSFGGKVVLATRAALAVRQTWVLDASPSARPDAIDDPDNTVVRVLRMMQRLPTSWPRREDFVAAVVADGHDAGLANWLAMNLAHDASGVFHNKLDRAAISAMLLDYYATDLWSSLADPRGGAVEIVVATRARTLSTEDRTRLAHAPQHVHVHPIDAGHWLHIDAPDAVVELFESQLP